MQDEFTKFPPPLKKQIFPNIILQVTLLDTVNVKAYFRRGQARQLLQDYEEAIGDFQGVLKLEPLNKAAQKQLAVSKKRLKEEREKERKRYANMFSRLGRDDDENDKV